MAKAAEEALVEIAAQRKQLQEELQEVASIRLPRLMNDKSGLLEIAVREGRNVVPPEEQEEEAERPVRYIVSIKPATVVVDEGSGSDYEFTDLDLPAKATFNVSSMEAKVVVNFGRTLEHHVSVVLTNSTKDMDLERLSDWHTSTAGEETETPQIQDVSDVPAVRLGFSFKRANRDEVTQCTERIKQIQNELTELGSKERSLKGPSSHHTVSIGKGRTDEDDEDEKPRGGVLSRFGQWMVFPFIVLHKWGVSVMHVMWERRSIVMFFGGAIFFHFRGDDCAV